MSAIKNVGVNKWLLRVAVPAAILSTSVAGHASFVPKVWATGDSLLAADLNANFNAVVDLSTNQTIAGQKTFTNNMSITAGANNVAVLQINGSGLGIPVASGIQTTDSASPQFMLRASSGPANQKTWRFISRSSDGSAQFQTLSDAYGSEKTIINMAQNGAVTIPAGGLTITAGGCTGCSAPSDARLKTNVRPVEHALEDVKKLRGVRFDWKKTGAASMGVIAQELETVYPELVITDREGMKTVEYGQLAGALIEATKDLDRKNQELERKNAELTARLDRLERLLTTAPPVKR